MGGKITGFQDFTIRSKDQTMAITLKEVSTSRKETLKKFQQEVGLYVAAHPEAPFRWVAQLYGCSQSTVSQAARSVGLKPRQRGRKKRQPQSPVVEAK